MRRRRGPRGHGAALVVGALLLLLLIPSAPSATPNRIGFGPPGTPMVATHCSGSAIDASLTGSLIVVGGPSPLPTVAGQTVWLTYFDELNFTPSGSTSIDSCQLRTTSAVTDGLGGFSIAASVPSSGCIPGSCSFYSGPYAPATFSLVNGTPTGYFLTQSLSGSTVGLDLVYGLTGVSLAPTSRVTLSVNAPTTVKATPLAANNAPSPASVAFSWKLAGPGWAFVGGTTGANVTIEASVGAQPGTLSVWANGTYNGTPMGAGPATLQLAAAATVVDGGDVTPTTLDAGNDATFTVTGVGAAGYSYTAAVTPGLGLPVAMAPCTFAIAAGGLWDLTCAVSVTYPAAGSAVPSAVLSNGFSTAPWTFPPISVAQPIDLSLAPIHLVTYALAPEAVQMSVPGGTGVQPYHAACLWPGDGTTQCVMGPGPTYAFTVDYGRPGEYDGHASLEDATGANASTPFSASVYAPLLAPTVQANVNEMNVTAHATITAVVSGGALPIAYWWNTSSPGGTLLQGTLPSDGTLLLDFSPHVSGLTDVDLSLVDALGRVENGSTKMLVVNGPPEAIADAQASNWIAIAGTPFPISWVAVDPAGEPVPLYAAPTWVDIALAGTAGSTPFVALTPQVGSVTTAANGSFVLNASAWRDAYLNFSIVIDGAGTFTVTAGSGLPIRDTPGSGRLLLVGPNLRELSATDPVVALAGSRTNHTLWAVHDRFGDPLTGGDLVIRSVFGGAPSTSLTPVLADASGSRVWLNYSAPGDLSGTVQLLTILNDSVLIGNGTALLLQIPAPAGPAPYPVAWWVVLAGVAVLAALAGAVMLGRRRREDGPAPGAVHPPATEGDLRRLAEGRAHILARADPWIGRTLDELTLGFVGRPPSPEEVTEWVASLVADGSLKTVLGEDGRSRFLRRENEEPAPMPKVELDPAALDAALERQGDDGEQGPGA